VNSNLLLVGVGIKGFQAFLLERLYDFPQAFEVAEGQPSTPGANMKW
jgi:hypothetical protein